MVGVEPLEKQLTLVLIHTDERVLLGLKKRGFGAGRWNGFGGKVEAGESALQAAHREFTEETGAHASSLEPAGSLRFHFVGDPVVLRCHLFRGSAIKGEPKETEEMRPAWFSHSEVPYDIMWPDDRHWLPAFLDGKRIVGEFHFQDQNTLDRMHVVVGGP